MYKPASYFTEDKNLASFFNTGKNVLDFLPTLKMEKNKK